MLTLLSLVKSSIKEFNKTQKCIGKIMVSGRDKDIKTTVTMTEDIKERGSTIMESQLIRDETMARTTSLKKSLSDPSRPLTKPRTLVNTATRVSLDSDSTHTLTILLAAKNRMKATKTSIPSSSTLAPNLKSGDPSSELFTFSKAPSLPTRPPEYLSLSLCHPGISVS